MKITDLENLNNVNTTDWEYITGRIDPEHIQSHAIALLEHYGADPDRLWLCEAQTIDRCADYYGHNYIINDLTANSPKNHTHILYYHENGYIAQSATFNPDNPKTLAEAAKFVTNHM